MAKVKVVNTLPTGMWVVAQTFSDDPSEGPVGQPISTKVMAVDKIPDDALNEFLVKLRREAN